MFWKPARALGLVVGLVILLTIVGVQIFLVQSVLGQPPGLSAYLTALLLLCSVPLLVLCIHWYYGLLTLRYYMDRNALVILSGAERHIVPMGEIRRIAHGRDFKAGENIHGIGWPGYLKGTATLGDLGRVMVHATEPLDRQLIVVTDRGCYGISPRDVERFLDEFESRRALGPLRRVEARVAYLPYATLPVWRDRALWGALLAAAVVNVILFGVVSGRYSALPERFPLPFGAQREALRIISRGDLYLLPGIGAIALLLNGVLAAAVHGRERLGAYVLAASAALLQLPLWLATLGAMAV